jgi:hypothetical protein
MIYEMLVKIKKSILLFVPANIWQNIYTRVGQAKILSPFDVKQ